MIYDSRYAQYSPDPDNSLEYAVRLLAACPSALANLKTPKEIFDKTVELADMFRNYSQNNSLPKDGNSPQLQEN